MNYESRSAQYADPNRGKSIVDAWNDMVADTEAARNQIRVERMLREQEKRRKMINTLKGVGTGAFLALALIYGVHAINTEQAEIHQRQITQTEQKIENGGYGIIENATLVIGEDGANLRAWPKVVNVDDNIANNVVGTLKPGQKITSDLLISGEDTANGPFYGISVETASALVGDELKVPENCDTVWLSKNTVGLMQHNDRQQNISQDRLD